MKSLLDMTFWFLGNSYPAIAAFFSGNSLTSAGFGDFSK